jgi:hypothetical protein
VLASQNQQISTIKSGNISTISDGSYNLSLLYSSKNKNTDLLITASVLKDKTVKIFDIKQITTNSAVNNTPTTNNNIASTDTLGINYKDFDPNNPVD